MPITVIAGLRPKPLRHRTGPDFGHPVQHTGVGAHPLGREIGVIQSGRVGFVQARHRHVAVVVVQAGQQPHQHAQCVGNHAAPDAGVQPVVQRCHLDHAVDDPAQRYRQRRNVDASVVRVGDDDDVGGQRVAVGGKQPAQ